ncbi:MAG: O-antigen ligase family protein [Candidatus Omnitrophica bacterium]|nr:O-antigen ligase family protein [Candidatus Omnitrophota bacterium]
MQLSGENICTFLIAGLVYFLLILSPFAYGSVEILPLTILETLSFVILFIWLLKLLFISEQSPVKAFFWFPLLIFISLVIFQLILLPKTILGTLSPKHLYIYANFLPPEVASRIQYCISVYREATTAKLLELLSYAAVFFVLVNNLESKQQIRQLVIFIVSLGFLVSIFGIAKNFTYPFINRNHYAGYLEMILFLGIGLLLTDMDRQKRVVFSFMAVIMILGILLSLSRAGFFSFLISLAIMFYLLRLRRTIKKRSALVLSLFIFALVFLLFAGAGPFWERILTMFRQESITAETRWLIWKDTFKIISDFPVFGSGLGTFRNIYPMYKTITSQAVFAQAHSDVLQLISETGFLGFGMAFLFLCLFFKDIFTAWFSRHHPFFKGITLGGICAIISILVHSFFDFNLQIPANAMLLTIVMATTYKCIFLKDRGNEINQADSNI